MSNTLSVRRVQIQEIDKHGKPVGKPSFGILASDNYERDYTDAYDTREELEAAITEAGNILDVLGGFPHTDRDEIGTDNFFGASPSTLDDEDEDEEDDDDDGP